VAPEQTTNEQEPNQKPEETPAKPKAEKKAPVQKATKLICKGPHEVSVHVIDEEFESTLDEAEKVGAGSVKGIVLLPGQYVDVDSVPSYVITDEIKNGKSDFLELVTAQEASIYKPTPEGEIVPAGMEIPRNNHMARAL
jgi:hypothetical protein